MNSNGFVWQSDNFISVRMKNSFVSLKMSIPILAYACILRLKFVLKGKENINYVLQIVIWAVKKQSRIMGYRVMEKGVCAEVVLDGMTWEVLLEGTSLSWVLNDRKKPKKRGPRQRDSKCKGPATETNIPCVRKGRNAPWAEHLWGRRAEDGVGEESRVSSLMFIAKQHSVRRSDTQHSGDASASFIFWGI